MIVLSTTLGNKNNIRYIDIIIEDGIYNLEAWVQDAGKSLRFTGTIEELKQFTEELQTMIEFVEENPKQCSI